MSNLNKDSMWHKFITELEPTRIIGFTATPYRNDCGLIYTGANAIYGGIAYEYTVKQGIKDGFLSTIIPKRMATHFDMTGVKTQNGDFAEGQMQERVNIKDKNEAVIDEVIKYGSNRKGWLIFSAGCDHAHELDLILKRLGYSGAVVLGDTPDHLRDQHIADYKAQKLQYLINNAVLTKGFDAPHTDLIAATRPTKSPVLWTQMVGRGFRLSEGKENCLLLDFAENVERFGFIDEITFSDKKPGNGDKEGVPPVKTCEECEAIVPAGVLECPFCGHVFPKPEPEFNKESYDGAVLSTQVLPEWKNVEDVYYAIHKTNKPNPTLKVEYVCENFERYFEYICFEHEAGTFPRKKAIKWWKENADGHLIKDIEVAKEYVAGGMNPPKTIKQAHDWHEAIIKPSKIKIIQEGKFWRVLDRDNRQPLVSHQPEPEYNHGLSQEELNEISLEI